jgi:hypothetical protein
VFRVWLAMSLLSIFILFPVADSLSPETLGGVLYNGRANSPQRRKPPK